MFLFFEGFQNVLILFLFCMKHSNYPASKCSYFFNNFSIVVFIMKFVLMQKSVSLKLGGESVKCWSRFIKKCFFQTNRLVTLSPADSLVGLTWQEYAINQGENLLMTLEKIYVNAKQNGKWKFRCLIPGN